MDSPRALHWVFKVGNLKRTVEFLQTVLGMHVLRHEEFSDGCEASCNGKFDRPWSKTMIGYGDEKSHFVLELTYNYGVKKYEKGNDLRHITISADPHDIYKKAKERGFATEKGENCDVFVFSPDGYRFRIVGRKGRKDPVVDVSLNVSNVTKARSYYETVMQMAVVHEGDDRVTLSLDATAQASLELVQSPHSAAIDHKEAYGRIAFAADDIMPYHQRAKEGGHKILHEPITLPTPGKADVQVVILLDQDQYEICVVGSKGFADLCSTAEGDDLIEWEKRAENGADRE